MPCLRFALRQSAKRKQGNLSPILQCLREGVDLLGVEDLIVALE